MSRAALFLLLALALVACSGDRAPPQAPPTTASRQGGAALPPGAAGDRSPTQTAPTTVAPPTPAVAAEPPLPEPELPRADRVDLARRLRGITADGAAPAAARPEERPGDRRDFWVIQTEPARAFQIAATLRAVTAHAYFYVQDGTRVSDADMNRAAQDFETRVYPMVTKLFGEPEPRQADAGPRITILHLNLPGVGGYFTGVDQLPRQVARISNERRMIYIDLRAGPPGTSDYLGVVAHELQHLIHQDHNPHADAWLNEGLSEVANEATAGWGGYLRAYENAPGTQLNDWFAAGSNAAHYGAAHAFLRYLLRHYGGLERARELVTQGGSGVNAVQKYLREGAFGAGFEDVFADWLVAGYLDLPGDGRFSNPDAETRVRTVTRLTEPADGRGGIHQFGADYFEVEPRGKDAVFRFRGATTVKQVPNEPASGGGQWWSNRRDSLDATLTRELDLRSVTTATLRFKTWYDIEHAYDYAYVTVSTDGGASWTVLRGRQTTDVDPLGMAYGPGYTGRSGGGETPVWVDEQIDLTPYAGRRALLRFEYVTDESAVAAGLALDDISVPEIGFFDDAEQDGGWQAAGFRRLTAPLPQRYLIQLVVEEGGGWTSRRVDVAPDGTVEIRIPGGQQRAAVIIAGATYGTNLPADYQWSFGPAGG